MVNYIGKYLMGAKVRLSSLNCDTSMDEKIILKLLDFVHLFGSCKQG